MYKYKIALLGVFVALGLVLALPTKSVYADQYGGCDDCNKRFRITKEVRIEGDTTWKDKVTDVKDGQTVEFKITVKNKSDDNADEADGLKIKDFLPSEMTRVGGSDLIESWSDFKPGDEKKFTFEAKVNSSEYDRDVKFEKCVVNKVELTRDGDFEGSDTATVCYGNVTPSELPKTGAESTLALTGLGLIVTGFIARKKFGK